MKAVVTGIVMELVVKNKMEGDRIVGTSNIAMIYQSGEKSLIEVKDISSEIFSLIGEGECVSFLCRLVPWTFRQGVANITCSFVELVGDVNNKVAS